MGFDGVPDPHAERSTAIDAIAVTNDRLVIRELSPSGVTRTYLSIRRSPRVNRRLALTRTAWVGDDGCLTTPEVVHRDGYVV